MGEHDGWRNGDGRSNRGHAEHGRNHCQDEVNNYRQHCRPEFKPVPVMPMHGCVEIQPIFPVPVVRPPQVIVVEPRVMYQPQQCAPRGNYVHGWQRGGYDQGQPNGNYMHGWQRGGYEVYQPQPMPMPYPVQQAPTYYRNDNVSGGRGGYQANRTQYETGVPGGYPQDVSPMGQANQVFDQALKGFDAWAAYDIARRHSKR